MVTCTECHSTFSNKTKMKKHVNEEHNKEERQEDQKESPPRKESKKEDLNERIASEQEQDKNSMEESENEEEEVKEAKKEEEVLGLRKKIYDQGLRLYSLEQEKETLIKENKSIKDKANTEVRELEEYIKQEAKSVQEKVKKLETTMVQQIDIIERQNKEIEKYKAPKATPAATSEDTIEPISIKCKECSFTGRTMHDLREHKNTVCSEGLTQRLLEEDAGRAQQETREVVQDVTRQELAQEETGEREAEGNENESWEQQGRKRFECPICGLGRRTKGQIENHMSSHDKQIDECVQNLRCDGNCEHVEGHKEKEHCSNTGITCYDCKQKFKDKTAMMDHKRDSDHPSKRKCNQFPDCERGVRCWYRHIGQVSPQASRITEPQTTSFTCKDCEQVFNNKNELMFHKKRAHPSNIMCTNFLNGYCRRGNTGEHCWYRHDQLPTTAPSVARPQISPSPPGSTSSNLDFPVHPTMGQSPVVGLQQQMIAILKQQTQQQQQQQQHQQQMNILMSKLVNLNM